jgi:mono/diheme cytochrome c family protein
MMRTRIIATAAVLLIAVTSQAQDKIDFAKQIQPIFAEHCIKCHGEKMASGKMRLHTAAGLKEKWDADKELIVAGDPEKSELYQRLVLPADDKKRMPRMADPLPKETIELISNWIKQDAALPDVAAAPAAAPTTPAADKADEAPAEKPKEPELPEVSAAPQEAIDKLTAAGAQVLPLFADSSLLQVSFAHRGEPAGDAELALLTGVAEQVYALNLADAKATDAGWASLAVLKNLATLHLERSAVNDAGLAHLAGLSNLQYLNLYGTGITDEGLKHLAGLKHLQRLYLWQTKASYDAAMAMEKDIPGLIVNLGYDHPVVAKMRLTKELEQVKKQAEDAKAEQAKAEQALEGAKKNSEAVNARLSDIEKQLKELEPPAEAEKKAETTEEKPKEGEDKPAEGEAEKKPADENKDAEKPDEEKE